MTTGYQDIVKHMRNGQVVSTEVKDEYVFLRVGEKLLLVKAPPGKEQLEYSGELETTAVQRDRRTGASVDCATAGGGWRRCCRIP